ncbi:MAG: winged helix-turn-helix domain-containing protein [Candidatus Bathyarchaeia archaeon]
MGREPLKDVGHPAMSAAKEYRDRIYMRKDILLKLVQHGELNQTALLSYCGLNLQKHKFILDEMEEKGLIERKEGMRGKRRVTLYSITPKGQDFLKRILEPYEAMFPRRSG